MSTSLEGPIAEIGERMAGCTLHCAAISLDLFKGILPRCLFLETKDRTGDVGVVVVGINPGRSKSNERKFYRRNGQTYEQTVIYWHEHVGFRHPYYKRLRDLVTSWGFKGPILWTELAKCENATTHTGLLPLQTLRTCTQSYLQQELQAVPKEWPLIAVGLEAYKALAYLFPSRTVVGVPHPTGSRGHFARMLAEVRRNKRHHPRFKDSQATWLTA